MDQINHYLSPKDVFDISKLYEKVAVPNYKYKSKLGIRLLTSKEIFGIWGQSQLTDASLSIDDIITYVPTQPLSLVLKSYLMCKRPKDKIVKIPPMPLKGSQQNVTFFSDIGVSITNEWTAMDFNSERSKKADNAPVPSELWDKRLTLSFDSDRKILTLANCLRTLALSWYRRQTLRSFCNYLRRSFPEDYTNYLLGQRKTQYKGEVKQSDFLKSIEIGRDVLKRASLSTWFEWKGGSTLVFWRWKTHQLEARDGFPMYILKNHLRKTPKRVVKVSPPSNSSCLKLYLEKLGRLLNIRYIQNGYVHWDIKFFHVPKGEDDIRLVFDRTSSGVN